MRIGVLGLQGAVDLHLRRLAGLGVEPTVVRRPEHLENLAGIVLPGGESSTMLKLLEHNQLFDPLKDFITTRPTWGLCAGAILLAKTVTSPSQPSLGVMDIKVTRNAYGRQLESFISELTPVNPADFPVAVEGVFIRAPKIELTGSDAIEPILTWRDEPVMVRQEHFLAASFHPELSPQDTLHRYFLDMIRHYL